MADTTGTPPAAANAGNVDLGAILKDIQVQTTAAIAEAIKPFATQLADLQKGQQAVQEAVGKAIKAEDVQKAVAEAVKAQTAAGAVDAKKQAARQAVIAAKLKDVPEEFLAKLPDTDDPKALSEAADAIVTRVNDVMKPKLPDVGGAGKDGGTAAGGGGAGGFLKMPG